jgi:hypothetical protein
MNDIYIKIVGIESGNVILQVQNNGLTFHPFFFFFFEPEKIYQTSVKFLFPLLVLENLNVANASSNV